MNYYLSCIIDFFKRVLYLIRYGLYKIFLVIWAFATIGKWIAVILLVLNVIEAFQGTFITQTKYFTQMLTLFGAEILLHVICFILKPRDTVE